MTFRKIKKTEAEERLVFAEVYAPDMIDTHGDFMTAPEIKKMAYDFARKGRLDQVDVCHDNNLYGCNVVETFVARSDDSVFIPGSWVVGVHVPDDELWSMIKSGEINGFSMESLVLRKQSEREFDLPVVLKGYTQKTENGHKTPFTVFVDENGKTSSPITGDFYVEEVLELNK